VVFISLMNTFLRLATRRFVRKMNRCKYSTERQEGRV
jgi:hypothetical protein